MTTTEKRELLIAFMDYYNGYPGALQTTKEAINSFLSTLPDEWEKACTHPLEAIAYWNGEVFCVRCKQVIKQSNPNPQ